jgi:EmrB/QacA subfamily drug resistance transporter
VQVASAAGRWVIVATVLGSGMAAIDATVVGIALPTIGREFHASVGALQWVVTGYTLSLAALLLLGGSLGDHYGRRRMFVVGVILFAACSMACAAATSTTFLIVTRVLQGVGAALLTPESLAILQATFSGEEAGRAIGAWSGYGGLATAAGPLLGGYLIAAASWRWIFVINVPLGAIAVLLALRHVPESRDRDAGRHLDVRGAVLATVALGALTFGLIEGPSRGWSSPSVIGMLAAGTVAGVGFFVNERRSSSPMLPLAVFRQRQFVVTNGVTFVVYAALGGVLFLLPIQLQVVDKYTTVESGLALLPLTFLMLLLSARSGRLAARIGPRLQMSVGPVVVGIGLALLARTATDSSYGTGVLPAVVVFGLGLAIVVAPLTATALAAVPGEHAGLASAVNNDVARVGGLIAVAVLPAIAGLSGTGYLHPATMAAGFRTAALCAGALCAAGGIVAAAGIRNPVPSPPVAVDLGGVRTGGPSACMHCALDAAPMATTADAPSSGG